MRFRQLVFSGILAISGALLSGCGASVPETALLSPAQKEFLGMAREERVSCFANAEKRLKIQKAGDLPRPVTYRPAAEKTVVVTLEEADGETLPAALAVPRAARESAFDGGRVKVLAPPYVRVAYQNGALYFCNLKLAQDYEMSEEDAESGSCLAWGDFRTEAVAPRLMAVDKVPNVRDLGGRIGLNGRRVRQGLLYRSAGLNDNAAPEQIPVTAEMEDELAWRTPCKEHIQAGIRAISAVDPKRVEEFDANDKWVVYAPGRSFKETDALVLTTLTVTPDELLGMSPRPIELNAAKRFAFPVPSAYSPSIFIKKIVSDEARVVRAGCGADWFFRVYLNGKEVFDALRSGNGSAELVPADNPMLLPLEKGENMLVIPVLSGSASWTFSFGAVSMDPATIQARQLANLNRHLRELDWVETGRFLPGANRLSPAMQRYLVEDLGIRTDLDLRSPGECFGMDGSPAGERVQWVQISSSCYNGMASEEGRKAFAKAFRLLLDERNYPVIFHCIAGQDRTGSLAFILNALLGVDEEELYRDWEASGFWNASLGFSHRSFSKLLDVFQPYRGETLQQKVEDYVKGCGFSSQEIEKFRAIMLEAK